MASSSVVQRRDAILELLRDKSVKEVTLTGDSGVGKTWTAEMVSELAMKKGWFDITLWLFLNGEYNEAAARESIARQLSLLPYAEEWDATVVDSEEAEAAKVENNVDLQKKIAESVAGKKLLLILDYEGRRKMDVQKEKSKSEKMDDEREKSKWESLTDEEERAFESEGPILDSKQKTVESESHPVRKETASRSKDPILDVEYMKKKEEQIISKLETMLNLVQSSYKVMITRMNASKETKGVITVEPLSVEESLYLLQKMVKRSGYDVPTIKSFGEAFIQKTKYMPASIILMAKTISYFGEHGCGAGMPKRVLEEASTEEFFNLNQLRRTGYDHMLPKSIIIDCCLGNASRDGHFFLSRRKCIHYNELIAYWILEGYLGHVDCLKNAYEKGHSVFIELVDCQLLRKLEGGFVTVGSGTNHLEDVDRYGFQRAASLWLADLSRDSDWEGFGRLTYTDGMVKSVYKCIKGLKLSTLFVTA